MLNEDMDEEKEAYENREGDRDTEECLHGAHPHHVRPTVEPGVSFMLAASVEERAAAATRIQALHRGRQARGLVGERRMAAPEASVGHGVEGGAVGVEALKGESPREEPAPTPEPTVVASAGPTLDEAATGVEGVKGASPREEHAPTPEPAAVASAGPAFDEAATGAGESPREEPAPTPEPTVVASTGPTLDEAATGAEGVKGESPDQEPQPTPASSTPHEAATGVEGVKGERCAQDRGSVSSLAVNHTLSSPDATPEHAFEAGWPDDGDAFLTSVGDLLQYFNLGRTRACLLAERRSQALAEECLASQRTTGPDGFAPDVASRGGAVSLVNPREALLRAFDTGDADGFTALCKARLAPAALQDNAAVAAAVFNAHVSFYVRGRDVERLKAYLAGDGAALSQDPALLPLFALPAVATPDTHPTFAHLFEPTWLAAVRASLVAALASAMGAMPVPRLLSAWHALHRLEARRKLAAPAANELGLSLVPVVADVSIASGTFRSTDRPSTASHVSRLEKLCRALFRFAVTLVQDVHKCLPLDQGGKPGHTLGLPLLRRAKAAVSKFNPAVTALCVPPPEPLATKPAPARPPSPDLPVYIVNGVEVCGRRVRLLTQIPSTDAATSPEAALLRSCLLGDRGRGTALEVLRATHALFTTPVSKRPLTAQVSTPSNALTGSRRFSFVGRISVPAIEAPPVPSPLEAAEATAADVLRRCTAASWVASMDVFGLAVASRAPVLAAVLGTAPPGGDTPGDHHADDARPTRRRASTAPHSDLLDAVLQRVNGDTVGDAPDAAVCSAAALLLADVVATPVGRRYVGTAPEEATVLLWTFVQDALLGSEDGSGMVGKLGLPTGVRGPSRSPPPSTTLLWAVVATQRLARFPDCRTALLNAGALADSALMLNRLLAATPPSTDAVSALRNEQAAADQCLTYASALMLSLAMGVCGSDSDAAVEHWLGNDEGEGGGEVATPTAATAVAAQGPANSCVGRLLVWELLLRSLRSRRRAFAQHEGGGGGTPPGVQCRNNIAATMVVLLRHPAAHRLATHPKRRAEPRVQAVFEHASKARVGVDDGWIGKLEVLLALLAKPAVGSPPPVVDDAEDVIGTDIGEPCKDLLWLEAAEATGSEADRLNMSFVRWHSQ